MIDISTGREADGSRRVRFVVPDDGVPVSVVGDWNDWDPMRNPLRRRSNGTRSAIVELGAGRSFRFRYLADGGRFFNDSSVGDLEPNGYGQDHAVLAT